MFFINFPERRTNVQNLFSFLFMLLIWKKKSKLNFVGGQETNCNHKRKEANDIELCVRECRKINSRNKKRWSIRSSCAVESHKRASPVAHVHCLLFQFMGFAAFHGHHQPQFLLSPLSGFSCILSSKYRFLQAQIPRLFFSIRRFSIWVSLVDCIVPTRGSKMVKRKYLITHIIH